MPKGPHATIYIEWEIRCSRSRLSHAFRASTYKPKWVRNWTSGVLSISFRICAQPAAPACDEGYLSFFPLGTWAWLRVHVASCIPKGVPGPIHSLIQHTAIHHCDSQTSSMIRQRWEEDQSCSVLSCLCTNFHGTKAGQRRTPLIYTARQTFCWTTVGLTHNHNASYTQMFHIQYDWFLLNKF